MLKQSKLYFNLRTILLRLIWFEYKCKKLLMIGFDVIGLEVIGLEVIGLELIRLEVIEIEVIGLEVIELEMIGGRNDRVRNDRALEMIVNLVNQLGLNLEKFNSESFQNRY